MVIFLTKTTYFCGSVFFPVSCEIESHIFRFGYQSQCFVKTDSNFLSNCYQSIIICVVFFFVITHIIQISDGSEPKFSWLEHFEPKFFEPSRVSSQKFSSTFRAEPNSSSKFFERARAMLEPAKFFVHFLLVNKLSCVKKHNF